MGGEWEYKPIDEVAEKVAMGPFGSSIKVSTFVTEGIPILSGQHLNETQVQDGENNFITHAHADKLRNANVFRGDVIFTHAGNIGQVAYIPKNSRYERYVISQRQFYMRCNTSKILPEFVAYYFKSPQGQHKLLANSTPSGVPSIARPVTYLRSIEIPVPTILEQKRVVQMLVSVDNKIEANRKINKTLEEIARTIFKHWFIDFEFPNENGEPYKSSGGEMIDSPLGPIPKRWRVGNISDIANILGGGTPRTSIDEYWDGDIPFFTPKDAKALYCIHTEKCLTKKGLQSCSSRLYEKNTVFITARGTVGKLALAGTPMAMNQSCYALIGKEVSQNFLYLAIDNLVDSLKQSSHGAVFSTITTATLESTKVLIPEASVERDFRGRIASFFETMLTNDEENGKLSELRDSLLPKLMSGEIRIPVSEKEDDQL